MWIHRDQFEFLILSYNDIIHLHDYVLENWEHPWGYYKGPQLERILEKGLQSFPCLVMLDMEATVEFYDTFHKTSFLYLMQAMPFDCVSIKMGYELGLGLLGYTMIALVLMELLPCLLPRADAQITLLVNMVQMDSRNG